MGSYYDLRIGGYSVLSNKWRVEEVILSLFVEADRATESGPPDLPSQCANCDAEDDFFGYRCTAHAIADRLDVLGFTPALAKSKFSSFLECEIQDETEMAESWEERGNREADPVYGRLREAATQRLRLLSGLSFDTWVQAMSKLKNEGIRWPSWEQGAKVYARELTAVEAYILESEREHRPLGFFCTDLRCLIRAFLLCSSPSDLVVLDLTDMVHAGYFEAAQPLTLEAKESISANARSFERILVLTEGRTDSRILEKSLSLTYPHLIEFFSFLDHGSFAVPGGAGNLLSLLKGFAGAGVSNRVIAVFDNDAAGSVQVEKARDLKLPRNFRILQLPHLASAERYPTLGPTGLVDMDINGSACSIEVYLGASALADTSGRPVPVQWTGFEKALGRYQGELLDKQKVQERFLHLLEQGAADLSDIVVVLNTLIAAFNH
jgi:hypothetical protein